MPNSPEVILNCVHYYSMIGDNRRSRYYDRLFVHMMKNSMESSSRLDSRGALE